MSFRSIVSHLFVAMMEPREIHADDFQNKIFTFLINCTTQKPDFIHYYLLKKKNQLPDTYLEIWSPYFSRCRLLQRIWVVRLSLSISFSLLRNMKPRWKCTKLVQHLTWHWQRLTSCWTMNILILGNITYPSSPENPPDGRHIYLLLSSPLI